MEFSSAKKCFGIVGVIALMTFLLIASTTLLYSQATVGTGSIQGIVQDPSGAAVPNAKVTIKNQATGQVTDLQTNSSGAYNAGSLPPGDFVVRIEKDGFSSSELPVTVKVGVISGGNLKLQVGQASQTVEVEANAITVNTEQATVQNVLDTKQIDNLPVNGRNFLDLAQLEPGVQIQDGQTFDPTKAGYSSISFNGVNGRTARIELDGLDISDETMGTTTQNISASAIEEFQVSRSSLDISTELTSSGAVNVSTRSGTNKYHGEGFGLFRDKRAGFANFPGGQDLPFQRNQFGGRFGGAIVKDKVFFFVNGERIKQDSLSPISFAGSPFDPLSGGFTSPFRDNQFVGKIDWNAPHGIRAFYRETYNFNKSVANFGNGYSFFANRDNTPAEAGGVDFVTGTFTHSIRAGYLKFHNLIANGLSNTVSPINPIPSVAIDVGATFFSGPNLLAPQQTYQSNKQFKYDGSKTVGSHIFRYGAGYNDILGGGFASFFGLAPQVRGSLRQQAAAALGPFPGGSSNPLNYPISLVIFGNGQGFTTEIPQFGQAAGGQQDKRFSFYIGDSWKVKPNFTLTYGVRYVRDTGRDNADLGPVPCSAVSPTITGTLNPCNGVAGSAPILDQLQTGLGRQVRQPDTNFGPQLGIAWDPANNGKTVLRGGVGLYFENSVFNNTLFDRPPKLAKGLFFNTAFLCGGTNSINFPNANGSTTTITSFQGQSISSICSGTIGQSGQTLANLQTAFQAATLAAGPAANGAFLGNALAIPAAGGLAIYDPSYRSPRSVQINLGIQRELWKGGVLSADYIRNIGEHFPLTVDANHVGDSRFLNKIAAQNAISATNNHFGCGTGFDQASSQCAIAAGATISDYAGNGLDSGNNFIGGSAASTVGLTPDTGAAFAGINPLFGQVQVQLPIGRSVYNGLQLSYRQNMSHPLPFLDSANLIVSYALSKFVSDAAGLNGAASDQNFSAAATDFRNATGFVGPTALDRTHQFSFGGTIETKYGILFNVITHFASQPATTLQIQTLNGQAAGGASDIFLSDLTGDGTVGDPINGTIGAFGRSVNGSNINDLITGFNNTQAGKLTPAGQSLVSAGLFTAGQLAQLGAVVPTLAKAPANEASNGIRRTFDLKVAKPFKVTESVRIEPSIGFYNLFNFSNFGTLNGQINSIAGSTSGGFVNGSDPAGRDAVRVGTGSGVFNQGAPRQTEFGLRITF